MRWWRKNEGRGEKIKRITTVAPTVMILAEGPLLLPLLLLASHPALPAASYTGQHAAWLLVGYTSGNLVRHAQRNPRVYKNWSEIFHSCLCPPYVYLPSVPISPCAALYIVRASSLSLRQIPPELSQCVGVPPSSSWRLPVR